MAYHLVIAFGLPACFRERSAILIMSSTTSSPVLWDRAVAWCMVATKSGPPVYPPCLAGTPITSRRNATTGPATPSRSSTNGQCPLRSSTTTLALGKVSRWR
jgi:hypothetical protein